MRWRFAVFLLIALASCTRSHDRGVRVTAMESWGAAFEVGIRVADVVSSWRQRTESGFVSSPLDIDFLVTEKSPRGAVELTYSREGVEHVARLTHGDWAMTTEPQGEEGSEESRAWRQVEEASRLLDEGEPERAREAFSKARASIDHPGLVTVVRGREILALGSHGVADDEQTRTQYSELVDSLRSEDPNSPTLAYYLDLLGLAQHRLFDERDIECFEESLDLYENFPNAEVERAFVTNHHASSLLRQGAHGAAEGLYRVAFELRASVTPYAPRTASFLGNAGLALRRQGRLDEAERVLLEGLDILLEVHPRSVRTGYVLRNLGLLALDKGDYGAAEGYYERALSIFEETRPDQFEVAGMVLNLGNVARSRGKLMTAEKRYRRALELRRELGVGSLDIASSLHNLGETIAELDRFEEASSLLEEALAIKQEHVPRTPLLATTLYALGRLRYLEGELDRSFELHERALRIRQSVVSDPTDTAESLFALARIAHDRGEVNQAYAARLEAVGILEAQRGRLAFGTHERSRFSARFHEEYRALAEFLVDQGRLEEGLGFIESSRGRSLRALTSQRVISRGAVSRLTSERNQLENRLSRTRSRLSRIAADDDDAYREAQTELREIQVRLDELNAEMGRVVPAIAAEDNLRRFSLARLRAALPLDTRLLSFSVGLDRTLVFLVSPAGSTEPAVRVHSIEVERGRIESEVDRFRAFIERGRIVSQIETPLLRLAHSLYEMLWEPLAADLEGVSRVVIVAEGPLLDVPFGALVSQLDRPTFLAEHMATSFQTSAIALSEFAEPERRDESFELVAFGDPDTAGEAATLPHARDEVARIASLFEGSAEAYIGGDADEARVKRLLPRARYVHLATHGVLDETFPLSSSLLLAPSASDDAAGAAEDGRLHAWEVVEQLNLSAELVVLSGCETGSGREVSGEGAMGLARAFRIAGAETVLGSLWRVSDRSTADLMARFYESIRSGDRSDMALAAARRQLIASKTWKHPYHWAAFRLFGAASRRTANSATAAGYRTTSSPTP